MRTLSITLSVIVCDPRGDWDSIPGPGPSYPQVVRLRLGLSWLTIGIIHNRRPFQMHTVSKMMKAKKCKYYAFFMWKYDLYCLDCGSTWVEFLLAGVAVVFYTDTDWSMYTCLPSPRIYKLSLPRSHNILGLNPVRHRHRPRADSRDNRGDRWDFSE